MYICSFSKYPSTFKTCGDVILFHIVVFFAAASVNILQIYRNETTLVVIEPYLLVAVSAVYVCKCLFLIFTFLGTGLT